MCAPASRAVIDLMLTINSVIAPLSGLADLADSKVDRHGRPSFRGTLTTGTATGCTAALNWLRWDGYFRRIEAGAGSAPLDHSLMSLSEIGSANSAPSLSPAVHLTTALARSRPGSISHTREPTSNWTSSATAMKPLSEIL